MTKGSEFQVPDRKVISKRIPYLIKQAQEAYSKQFEQILAEDYILRHFSEAVNDTFFTGPKRDRRAQDNIYLWGPRVYYSLSTDSRVDPRSLSFSICFEREDTLEKAKKNSAFKKIGLIYLPMQTESIEKYNGINSFLNLFPYNQHQIAWDFKNNKIVGTLGIRELLNEVPK